MAKYEYYKVIGFLDAEWAQEHPEADYWLLSYWHAPKRKKNGKFKGDYDRTTKKWKQFTYFMSAEHKLFDCGVFTFYSKFRKGELNIDREWMWEYTRGYAQFIKEWGFKDYECFEMDIGAFFDGDYSFTLELRDYIERESGVKVIPIWHDHVPLELWKEDCQTHRRVAMGDIVHRKDISGEQYQAALKVAKEAGCKIHGLGYAKSVQMADGTFPFDSGDTSSCYMIMKFLSLPKYEVVNGIRCFRTGPVKKAEWETEKQRRKDNPDWFSEILNEHNLWHIDFMQEMNRLEEIEQ